MNDIELAAIAALVNMQSALFLGTNQYRANQGYQAAYTDDSFTNEYNLLQIEMERRRALPEPPKAEVEGYTCYKCGLQMKGKPYAIGLEAEGAKGLGVCLSCFNYEAEI